VQNLQIGFDFTFFDIMLNPDRHTRQLGPIMKQLQKPQKKMNGIELAAENGGMDVFE